MKIEDFPLVEIEWIDAEFDFDAQARADALNDFFEDSPVVQDAGYLIDYNPERFVLATSRLNDQTIRHRNQIPTSLVRFIRFAEARKCLTPSQLLRTRPKRASSTATRSTTSRTGSVSGSESNLPSTTAPSTKPSPEDPSP